MARVWPIGPTTIQKHVLNESIKGIKKIKMSPIIDCLSSKCICLKIVSAGPLAVVNWLQIHVLKSFIWKNVNYIRRTGFWLAQVPIDYNPTYFQRLQDRNKLLQNFQTLN